MAGRYWREAATLMLIGRSKQAYKNLNNQKNAISHCDYDILCLKRSSGSAFMPEVVVFPGGKLDKADLNPKWKKLFEEKGYTENDLIKIFRFPVNKKVEMYKNKGTETLLPELAFRICALRETFEETGLLLSSDEGGNASVFPLEKEEIRKWRQLIQKDPEEFIKLFLHINGLPSAQNLDEWCTWLTPTFYGGFKSRFDTMFYITFIDSEITASEYDEVEVKSLEISRPMDILSSYYNKELSLKQPQLYELSRLVRYSRLEDVKDFSEKRASKGLARYLPVAIKCRDGTSILFPGDGDYPNPPNYFEEQNLQVDQTLKEYRDSCSSLNRTESIEGKLDKLFVKNLQPQNEHLIAVPYNDLVLTK